MFIFEWLQFRRRLFRRKKMQMLWNFEVSHLWRLLFAKIIWKKNLYVK